MPKVPTKPAPKAAAKKSSKPKVDPAIIYPEVTVSVCQGDEAITCETAMKLLGWRILPKDSKEEFLLKDNEGNSIQCTNNLINRPVYGSSVATLAQELLRGRWKMNGENLIIGQKGSILNGQHSLLALVMACQMYKEDPEAYPYWVERGHEPVMDKLVAFGIEESDDVVNTMDTCKPRSLADVVYRSEYFADVSTSVRKKLARILDYAVRLLWFRTGAGVDAYAPKRTHSEALAFINQHSTLLKCVRLIAEEDEKGMISKMISPGTAAGLMYLMATSSSVADEYHASENPREEFLNLDSYEMAEEFWIAISGLDKRMDPLKKALGNMIEESGGSNLEKVAVIVKAWVAFANHGTMNDKDLKLKYMTDEDGYKQLIECPTTGGIDVGVPSGKEEMEDVSPEEIKRRMEQVKNEHFNATSDAAKGAKKAAKGTAKKGSKASAETPKIEIKTFKDGEPLWVTDPDNGERWRGFYVDHQSHPTRGTYVKIKVDKGYAGSGKIMDINLDYISRS